MYLPSLLSLPTAVILLLCATSSAEPQWPHNLPRHMKYFPQEEVHARRGLGIQERLQKEKPVGVKKMGVDEGEMFMLENWIFASDIGKRSDLREYGNGTCQAQSPLRPLAEEDFFSLLRVRKVLLSRQFSCPAGTSSCSSIGAPDVCCGTGSTCINVSGNTDAGSIGCCPQGQTCAGPVHCDTANGYSSCPGSSNGGCCLPGFSCQGVGCVVQGTSTTYVQPPSSSADPPSSSTAVVVVPTTPSTTSTPTSTPTSTSTSTSTSAYTCSTGWFSCPASLGGGCCQNGGTCATGASCVGVDPASTQAPSAPVRPTSGSATTSVATSADVCPSGFYVCSAYYPSGCCRVGRDCQTTGTCVLPTATIVSTDGVVIVAPTGASVATTAAPQGGSCPSSWYSCPANQGGNCCPNGYECGEQCTATASGQSGVSQKIVPSTASFVSEISLYVMTFAAFAAGVAMVLL